MSSLQRLKRSIAILFGKVAKSCLVATSNPTYVTQLDFCCSDMGKLIQLLDSAHLDLRMAAGEVLALIFELGRAHDDDFCDNLADDLIGRLRSLATDSHKYRAKKDRKTQRSSFRDILQYVEVTTIFFATQFNFALKLHREIVTLWRLNRMVFPRRFKSNLATRCSSWTRGAGRSCTTPSVRYVYLSDCLKNSPTIFVCLENLER